MQVRGDHTVSKEPEKLGAALVRPVCFLSYLNVATPNPDVTPTQETAYLTETTFNLCQKHRSLVSSLLKGEDSISQP